MILLPAIDILEGKAVRLARGDFEQRTVYDADPLDAARRWVDEGARALHVVDLDGARDGRPVNLEHVRRIAGEVGVPVQVGGGLRTSDSVRAVLEAGAARVVLGTAALHDIDFLDETIAEHRERVVVSVDARGGLLAASGWTEQTEIPVESVIDSLGRRGVVTVRLLEHRPRRDDERSEPGRGGADRGRGARDVRLLGRCVVRR